MALITSIEYVEIALGASDTTNSTNLTKSQTLANCVPFVTKDVEDTGNYYDELYLDVYFESGPKVTAVRQTATVGVITLGIFVVEFDPTETDVQTGTFTIADASGSGTAAVDAVTLAETAMVFNYKTNGCGNTVWGNSAIRGYFSSTTQLTFDRQTSQAGAISGHWFTFEDIGDNFHVATYDGGIAASQTVTDTEITEVVMNKTFTLSSFRTIGSNDDTENYSNWNTLIDTTHLRAERDYAKNEAIESKVFVVEFDNTGLVQRGVESLGVDDAYFEKTITAVDLLYAMVSSATFQGNMQSDGSSAGNEECSFAKWKFNSNVQIRADRTSGLIAETCWEVVEWEKIYYKLEGKTYNKSGSILGTCNLSLMKDNLDDTCTVVDYTTSDGSGDYSFSGIVDDDAQYQIYAWKDDSPHIFDITDHVLLPKETPDTNYNLYLRSDTDKGETSPDKDLRLRSQADKLSRRRIFLIT